MIDIKPLTEYTDDRRELNNELFKILGRKEMKKLMPKSVKVSELTSYNPGQKCCNTLPQKCPNQCCIEISRGNTEFGGRGLALQQLLSKIVGKCFSTKSPVNEQFRTLN